jgi:hypothetical protein
MHLAAILVPSRRASLHPREAGPFAEARCRRDALTPRPRYRTRRAALPHRAPTLDNANRAQRVREPRLGDRPRLSIHRRPRSTSAILSNRWLSRDTTDLLFIARETQRAGAGIRSLAEPFLDTTSDFAEIIFAILGVAAKLGAPHSGAHRARPGPRQGQGRQVWPQADSHPAPAERGPQAPRSGRNATQRRPQLQCSSSQASMCYRLRNWRIMLAAYRKACRGGSSAPDKHGSQPSMPKKLRRVSEQRCDRRARTEGRFRFVSGSDNP